MSKPGVQAQEILKSVIQPGRMYAPACELAWSDHYAYVRGVDSQGELYYWEDQRKKAAHQAELAGYIGSVSRYEAERRKEESIRQRNNYLLELDQSVREEMRREQISREIAMEEAMEEKERLQEELRQEMEERRRQDEAMDKGERFFNMISGQGDWTNEELARMGRKSSDEMWTDERLRDMYRDKF